MQPFLLAPEKLRIPSTDKHSRTTSRGIAAQSTQPPTPKGGAQRTKTRGGHGRRDTANKGTDGSTPPRRRGPPEEHKRGGGGGGNQTTAAPHHAPERDKGQRARPRQKPSPCTPRIIQNPSFVGPEPLVIAQRQLYKTVWIL